METDMNDMESSGRNRQQNEKENAKKNIREINK